MSSVQYCIEIIRHDTKIMQWAMITTVNNKYYSYFTQILRVCPVVLVSII